jgi:hypothetical protein
MGSSGFSKTFNFKSNTNFQKSKNEQDTQQDPEKFQLNKPLKTVDGEKTVVSSFLNIISPIQGGNQIVNTIGQSSFRNNSVLTKLENKNNFQKILPNRINRSTTYDHFSSSLVGHQNDNQSKINSSRRKDQSGMNSVSDFKFSLKDGSNLNMSHVKRVTTDNFSKNNKFSLRGSYDAKKISNFNKIHQNKYSFLMVSPEDEVFDQNRHEDLNNFRPKKTFSDNIPKLNAVTKKLFKVYNMDNDYLKGIQKAKRRKNDLDLENYQNNLVQVLGDRVSKESIRKLNDKLKELRFVSNNFKKEEKIETFIENIEKVEENIINNLIKKEEKLESLRGNKLINANVPLPKIKYKKIRRISTPNIPLDSNLNNINSKL